MSDEMNTPPPPKKADFTPEAAVKSIRRWRAAKKFDKSDHIARIAMDCFPEALSLASEYAETSIAKGDWSQAIKRLKSLREMSGESPEWDEAIIRLSDLYVTLGQPGEALRILAGASRTRPGSLMLRMAMARVLILEPGGLGNAEPWRELANAAELPDADDRTRVAVVSACVAGLRLTGNGGEAGALFEKYHRADDPAWEEVLPLGYARLLVFHNGPTRMEYHAKLFSIPDRKAAVPERLSITFDPMKQAWDKEPFAFKPLCPKDTDFLCVRKRDYGDFHQDFSRPDFLKTALPIAGLYRDKVAFGQSLGAYCALYYASWIPGCRILASAPRNPLNPKYARGKYVSHDLFRHEYDMPLNPGSSPVVVYDSKNEEDGGYVERSLSKSFPNATFIRYPYCGHSITRYLLDVGLLKSSTLDFFEGRPFPVFDRRLRGNSSEYLRNVAKISYVRGRPRWAEAMLRRALELGRQPERTLAVFKRLGIPVESADGPPPAEKPEKKRQAKRPVKPPKKQKTSSRIRKWFLRRILHIADRGDG